MTRKFALLVFDLLGLFIVAACASANGSDTPVPTTTPQPTVEAKSLPTPIASGEMIVHNDLQVSMHEVEITSSYQTEYGSTREPSPGKKFIWIRILIKNTGQSEQSLPAPEHFSVIYKEAEFKPAYGHRQDHADYMALTTVLAPAQEVDAWLRFDIPSDLDLKDLSFAFLPDSTQISFGFSSSDYFWADHPIYLWNCAP